jgi:hypothetical protein
LKQELTIEKDSNGRNVWFSFQGKRINDWECFEERHSKKVITVNGNLFGGSRKSYSKTIDRLLNEEDPN